MTEYELHLVEMLVRDMEIAEERIRVYKKLLSHICICGGEPDLNNLKFLDCPKCNPEV